MELILASASPRRLELLSQVGIRCRVVPSNVAEEPLDGETPEEHVLRLAREKARKVTAGLTAGGWVLGADTIVMIGGKVLGKPVDEAGAARMLRELSGRVHSVMTGYCIVDGVRGKKEIARIVKTEVKVKDLTENEIEGYVSTGEPMDKAGAYAIQGIGSFMIEEIWGSYSNVVGLPLCQVVNDLESVGAVRLFGK